MKFTVVGAGATGGFLGARLAAAGEDVTLVARGAHLEAMRERGVRVRTGGRDSCRAAGRAEGELVAHPPCTGDLGAARDSDVVFLTVKATGLAEIAPPLGQALGPETAVVTAQNGIPWWYFERHGGPYEGTRLRSVDPDGVIARSIEARRVIGCVVWPATRLVEPGVIEHVEGTRFSIGELDGSRSERCEGISAALGRAGLKCPIRPRIRDEIWLKHIGNATFNPMSALTRATLGELASHPVSRAVARAAMEEAQAIAVALGARFEITIEQRIEGSRKVGDHKTSMLQDLESGRPLEVEALLGSVVELGDLVGVPVPHLRTLYACAKLLDESLRR